MTKYRAQTAVKKISKDTLFLLNTIRFEIHQSSIRDSVNACNEIINLFQSNEVDLNEFIYNSEAILLNISSIPYREGRLEFDKVKGRRYILPVGLNLLNAIAKEIIRIEELWKMPTQKLYHIEKRFLLSYILSSKQYTEESNHLSFKLPPGNTHIYQLSLEELNNNIELLKIIPN